MWLVGVVSRRWVWLVGVVSRKRVCLLGVVVRRYNYRFPHITYPYSSCICSFLQQHPYFLFIFKMFFTIKMFPLLFTMANSQCMCQVHDVNS